MNDSPKYPWRLATNERYREVIRLIIGLATASLLLPVFFFREFLHIKKETALVDVFSCSVYWSWGMLGGSILCGIIFHFLSAKWVRLAWGQPVTVFGIGAGENAIELGLHIFFWLTAASFIVGTGLIIDFVITYQHGS